MTDSEIVLSILGGNKKSFERIMLRYEERILRYLEAMLGDCDKAKDVAQETFIKIYVNLNSFDHKLKFSSWVYRIAHNEAINFLKKYKKEVLMDEGVWDIFIDRSVSDAKTIDQKLLQEDMIQYLDKLNAKYREPLYLMYFEDKSYEEISDILRIPKGTVGTRINRAKNQLAQIIINDHKSYER